MIVLAGFALALFLLAMASRGGEVSSEALVKRLAQEKDPRVVSAAAVLLSARGMHLTADVLNARAASMSTSATTGNDHSSPLPSPLSQTDKVGWSALVRAFARPVTDERIGPYFGMFGMHLRRLRELGCVDRVQRMPKGRWVAVWRKPRSEQEFLGNPQLQYQIFIASMRRFCDLLRRSGRWPSEEIVDGQAVTLSGLLALCHFLGTSGIEAWLRSPGERARQRDASEMFKRTNGMF